MFSTGYIKCLCVQSLMPRQEHVRLFICNIRLIYVVILLTATAVPNPLVKEVTFVPSTMPRDTDPPELILSFNVMIAPPTYVTCQEGSTTVDVAVLSREVTAGEYQPSSNTLPVTSVTVTLRTRKAGNYQCTVSVFRASMVATTNALSDAEVSPIAILGRTTMAQSVNLKEIKLLLGKKVSVKLHFT